jgi:hypothetical protein
MTIKNFLASLATSVTKVKLEQIQKKENKTNKNFFKKVLTKFSK